MLSKGCPKCGGDIMEDPGVLDGPEFKCLQCGHSVTIQYYQEKIADLEVAEVPPVPAVKERKLKHSEKRIIALEKDREAVLTDYQNMYLVAFFKKWKLNPTLWQKLKEKWCVIGKQPRKKKPADSPAREPDKLTEHAEYLILLGYQMAVREILVGGDS